LKAEVILSDKLFRSKYRFIAHQMAAGILQDSLLVVARSLEIFNGSSERAISAG